MLVIKIRYSDIYRTCFVGMLFQEEIDDFLRLSIDKTSSVVRDVCCPRLHKPAR